MFDAVKHGNIKKLSFMTHELDLNKADSGLTVEWFPNGLDEQYIVLLLDYERMPTYKRYQMGAMAHDLSNITVWNSNGGMHRQSSAW